MPRRILRVWRLDHVVLEIGSEPVLGAEDRAEGDLVVLLHQIDRVPDPAVDRRRVADQPDAKTVKASGGEQPGQAVEHTHTGIIDFVGSRRRRAELASGPAPWRRGDDPPRPVYPLPDGSS